MQGSQRLGMQPREIDSLINRVSNLMHSKVVFKINMVGTLMEWWVNIEVT